MEKIPENLGAARVLYYTLLDNRHFPTGNCRHSIGDKVINSFAGLAICQYENDTGYYLFYCDDLWNVVTDTFHESLKEAKKQAEFEFKGSEETWIFLN